MAKEARRIGGTGCQYKSHVIDETRTAIGVSVLLKCPEVWCTWSKDTVGAQSRGDELIKTKVGRRPTTVGQTTVEPVLGTVG
jgi:hypothetical protein